MQSHSQKRAAVAMVPVYYCNQSHHDLPAFHEREEVVKGWIRDGLAKSFKRGKAVQLLQKATSRGAELRDDSARMGPAVMEANADWEQREGKPTMRTMLARAATEAWRPLFV
jgi:hypothetical protein